MGPQPHKRVFPVDPGVHCEEGIAACFLDLVAMEIRLYGGVVTEEIDETVTHNTVLTRGQSIIPTN